VGGGDGDKFLMSDVLEAIWARVREITGNSYIILPDGLVIFTFKVNERFSVFVRRRPIGFKIICTETLHTGTELNMPNTAKVFLCDLADPGFDPERFAKDLSDYMKPLGMQFQQASGPRYD